MIPARLLAEGPSDDVLLPPLRWLLAACAELPVDLLMADLSGWPGRPRLLAEKVAATLSTHELKLLFVHRDADAQPEDRRREEIAAACGSLCHVPVIPVRTTEAWLLLDESVLRQAAGRPAGREFIRFPALKRVEHLPDPKATLQELPLEASGTAGRRRARFDSVAARRRLADLVDDWSPLRQLSAFQRLEADTRAALSYLGLPLRPQVA